MGISARMSASGAVPRLSLFYQRKRQTQVQISLIKIFYRLLNLDGREVIVVTTTSEMGLVQIAVRQNRMS